MLHFNFNQLTACMWDSKESAELILCPDTAIIGEIVTIGRGKAFKAVYIPCDVANDDLVIGCMDKMPNAAEIGLSPDAAKMIQYVASIKGYLFGYLLMP